MATVLSYIRNFRVPHPKIQKSGNELLAFVTRQGVNDKTVKCRAYWRHWNFKYAKWISRGRRYTAHDEENFCSVGDIVVLKTLGMPKGSKTYYVRNVIRQAEKKKYYDSLSEIEKRTMREALWKQGDSINSRNVLIPESEEKKIALIKERLNRIKEKELLQE